MANSKDPSRKKGLFGPARLPVSKNYIFPLSRRLMMLIGGTASALVLFYFLFSIFFLGDTFSSPGSLSSNHARFESQCAECHKSLTGIISARCSSCHEMTNDKFGVYTYAAHYLYRSDQPSRVDSLRKTHLNDEGTCATCHPEHRGNDTRITEVSDAGCAGCHGFSSFNSGHPEFEFARTNTPDDSSLKFTHILHTREVRKKLEGVTGNAYIERACLYCHNPQPDGKSFKPLDYDAHCGDCHLTTSVTTPPLAVKDPADPFTPGVETLQMIRKRNDLGTEWAQYMNEKEFEGTSRITKSPLYHRDPWVLENLKQLRRAIYSDPGVSELLGAVSAGKFKSRQSVYSEAIQTLKSYALALRSRPEPEVQTDLVKIDSLLRFIQRKASSQGNELPVTLFSRGTTNSVLTIEQKNAFEEFARKVARPCVQCHLVEQAAILGVQSSQRSLLRAEFDHRAHVLERRCLDCHTGIPVERALIDKDTAGIGSLDRASTFNIPGIQNCVECHAPSKASSACVTCHFMHPNKENRGSLMLAADRN